MTSKVVQRAHAGLPTADFVPSTTCVMLLNANG